MIVIETCPKCGRELETLMIATYPPIPKKMCMKCGWHWEGKREEVVRIPFKDPTEEVYDKYCDTAGNYHYTGTITGHHVIRKE